MATKIIGIDIRAAEGEGAGKSRYAEEITKALIKLHPETRLFIKNLNPKFPVEMQIQIPGRSIFWHLNLRKYLLKNPVDFFISPTSFIYPAIAPKSQRLAIVVHDMIAFLFPKNHAIFPIIVERLTLGLAIKNSEFIISVSQNTFKDLCELKPLAKEKPAIFAPPAAEFMPTAPTMNLPEKYLLAVGTIEPRKNLAAVFKAFKALSSTHSDLHLCIAGGKGWKTSHVFSEFPTELQDRIHFLGYVTNPQLSELYSRALCLVYPSFYEGFGIPPLEAMASGCPVLTSNISSLPEVVGDAAILIDPNNLEQIIAGIEELIKNPQPYREKGLERAKIFSWEGSAKKILEKCI